MNIVSPKNIRIALILFGSLISTAIVQRYAYEADILMSLAVENTINQRLIANIALSVAIHTALVSIIPVLLAAFKKFTFSYIALAVSLSAYLTAIFNINILGITLGVLAFSSSLILFSSKPSWPSST